MSLAHLHDIFPPEGFAFSMRMRPGDAGQFFAPGPEAGGILAERRYWLSESPARHSGRTPHADEVITAFADLTREWGIHSPGENLKHLEEFGTRLEPDFLLLADDATGRFTLHAGCVCFPSSWALEEKLGLPLEEIHGIVPGLNAAIGARIHQFLSRLKPGAAWLRSNWGISSSPARNQHPARAVNRLAADTAPATMWLRVEHQVLHRFANSCGVLFGIRLENVSLAMVRRDPVLRAGLRRALATVSGAVAAYKNLTFVRDTLDGYLAPD